MNNMNFESNRSRDDDRTENISAPEITQPPIDPRVVGMVCRGFVTVMGANGPEFNDISHSVAESEAGIVPPEEAVAKIRNIASGKQGNSINPDDPSSSSYLV